MRKGISILLVFVLCLFLVGQVDLMAKNQKAVEKSNSTIQLKGNKFQSLNEVKVPQGLEKKEYDKNERGHYIVRFAGPIMEEWRKQVEYTGAIIYDYIPDFAFLVGMKEDVKAKVKSFPFVTEILVYQPVFKLDPSLVDEFGVKQAKDGNYEGIFVIETFGGNGLHEIEEVVNKANGQMIEKSKKSAKVKLYRADLAKLAQLNNVKYIEEAVTYKLNNDIARGYVDADDMNNLGYDGSGQIVTVCDTGLDKGVDDLNMHLDFQGRIHAIYALGRLSDASDTHGHGTHVSGSVLGDGARSNGQIKGMAPAASLIMQSVLDPQGGLGGLPDDLYDLFIQPYADGSRIHTNSWGAAVAGQYTVDSASVDRFISDNHDMIVLFAAGNAGPNTGTIDAPGSAKNIITVGATENYRPAVGGIDADNPNEMAWFTSRGMAADGRIKPDVCAPGTSILSTRSSLSPREIQYNEYYNYMSGTSMATPITAGSVAVARQYMIENWGHTPNASFMKAILINGATDLGYGYPSGDQGWGRISLVDSLVNRELKWVDEEYNVLTGDSNIEVYAIESSNKPLRVSLVWTDVEGSNAASVALVNDLDLILHAPDGTMYYGNDFTAPYNDQPDRLNNVENVFIDNPIVGAWKVEVVGYNIPSGPQNYSVVASGDFGVAVNDPIPPIVSITAPVEGALVSDTVTLTADASDNIGMICVNFYANGEFIARDNEAPYSFDWYTNTKPNGNYTITARAYDTYGNYTDSAPVNITTNNVFMEVNEKHIGYVHKTVTGPLYHYIPVTYNGLINLELTWVEPNSDLDMFLTDPQGNVVASATSGSKPKVISYQATMPGTYEIKIEVSYLNYGNYILTAQYPKSNTPDITSPTVSVAAPAEGATVTEIVTISANANDNVDVYYVEFYADGQYLGTDYTKPYSIDWDTHTVEGGSIGNHILSAKAFDTDLNSTISTDVTVTVDNPCWAGYVKDGYPQSHYIDVTDTGTIKLELTWLDDIDYGAGIELLLFDPMGNEVASDYGSDEYTLLTYNATILGTYEIKIDAWWGDSVYHLDPITVPKSSNQDNQSPTVSITTPANGAIISGTAPISTDVTDNVAVSKVEFYVDDTLIGTDYTYPSFNFDFNTALVANGSHTLTVKAYDAEDNIATDSRNVSVENYRAFQKFVGYVDENDVTAKAHYIDVELNGKINLKLTWPYTGWTSLTLRLTDPAGNVVYYDGISSSIPERTTTYDATMVGTYKIEVSSGIGSTDYVLEAGYPNYDGNDAVVPTVSVTAPVDGSTVDSTISISANASDNNVLDRVEFFVNAELVGIDVTSPYSINWDSNTLVNGTYMVVAKAFDRAGSVGYSNVVNITVNNPDLPPTCNITAPADGATLNGVVTISADASDPEMDRVEFYVNGTLIGTDNSSAYTCDWDTLNEANGSYILEAKAFDMTGNVTTSSINVTVDNGSVTTETYTGFLDRYGTSEEFIYINVASGVINLSLTWDASADFDMALYAPSGTMVKSATSLSKPEIIEYTTTTSGLYKIRVYAYSGSANYTLTANYLKQ